LAARQTEVSPARACAYAVVRRVFERGAYADRVLEAEAGRLDQRDRALATAVAFGTVQRRATLDHVAAQLVHRPLHSLHPAVLAALRLGLFQLLYLDRVPVHAVVDDSVELAKPDSPAGARLVNAVLRQAIRRREHLLDGLSDDTPAGAAVAHSVPAWLAELWWSELGADRARGLLRAVNSAPESALRVNSLVSSVPEVIARLPVETRPVPELPEGLVLAGPLDVHGSELWSAGAVMAQSRASMLVGRVLRPRPGERVLDLCAAPGGKTTHLAALMMGQGEIVAVERHPGRARALEATCRRMHAGIVRVLVQDATDLKVQGSFDRVLVDPPCSGLGTLQSRPDRRWRASRAGIEELAALQARLLASGAGATRPGGTLVYSVCTISGPESERVINRFLAADRHWQIEDLGACYPQWRHPRDRACLQLLPDRDRTDGFFIARLRRSAAKAPPDPPSRAAETDAGAPPGGRPLPSTG
jgi:16S rRNA (cytosine967-C5)-methyltransferase